MFNERAVELGFDFGDIFDLKFSELEDGHNDVVDYFVVFAIFRKVAISHHHSFVVIDYLLSFVSHLDDFPFEDCLFDHNGIALFWLVLMLDENSLDGLHILYSLLHVGALTLGATLYINLSIEYWIVVGGLPVDDCVWVWVSIEVK